MKDQKTSWKTIEKRQCVETGLISNLVLLLLYFTFNTPVLIPLVLTSTILALTLPKLFYPLAILWFGLAHILSYIMPRILLALIFFVVITPVGVVRRLLGRDPMKLTRFKKDRASVMVVRDHWHTTDDLKQIF